MQTSFSLWCGICPFAEQMPSWEYTATRNGKHPHALYFSPPGKGFCELGCKLENKNNASHPAVNADRLTVLHSLMSSSLHFPILWPFIWSTKAFSSYHQQEVEECWCMNMQCRHFGVNNLEMLTEAMNFKAGFKRWSMGFFFFLNTAVSLQLRLSFSFQLFYSNSHPLQNIDSSQFEHLFLLPVSKNERHFIYFQKYKKGWLIWKLS